MNDLAARLFEARERAGLSQQELADKVGLKSQGTIGNLESRLQKSSSSIPAIANILGVSALWLAEGKGPKYSVQEPVKPYDAGNTEALEKRVEACPLISWVQAGDWTTVIDNFNPGDAEEWVPCPVHHGPRTYVLCIRGESMFNPSGWPSFRDGDLIFVDPDRAADHGSLVVVRLEENKEATFKKLVMEGEQKYLRPLNPAWPEPIIRINGNATLCGVVIGKLERY